MARLERFGVSMDGELLLKFDTMIEIKGYQSRSEAIRDLIRQEIIDEEWADPDAEVAGTITIVYEHHEHELSHILTELQHQYQEYVICSTHVHLDLHNCLEVIVLKGSSSIVKSIADALISTRGVKHGQLISTTTGRSIA